jgi:hypothetical protein
MYDAFCTIEASVLAKIQNNAHLSLANRHKMMHHTRHFKICQMTVQYQELPAKN